MNTISERDIEGFAACMAENERAAATIYKYIAAIRGFAEYLGEREITKRDIMDYREMLLIRHLPQSVNGSLGAIHSYLKYCHREDCRVKLLNVQHRAFLDPSREMTEEEYRRLLEEAMRQGKERLCLIMQTLGCTGIRVGELKFITVEAALTGRADIRMKGKCRTILLPEALRELLMDYAGRMDISGGYIFRTRSGRPVDRSNICHEMKGLCEAAGVDRTKVFPHNFRHLFARKFYELERDIARLADILGHSRIETTRLYVAVTAAEHEKVLNRMGMVYKYEIPQTDSSVVIKNPDLPQTDSSVVKPGEDSCASIHIPYNYTPIRYGNQPLKGNFH